MQAPTILFDAVLFDLDGTLVATDRFWVDAARAGAKRAFAELGIEREMPSAEDWLGLVGLPLAQGFDQLFADLSPSGRARVFARCVEEESQALRAGQAALLPGVRETLETLSGLGVRLGVASNCGGDYLSTMMKELELQKFVHEARCLDSPNAPSKAAMVADLLASFGTRAAVMVGDRLGDRDAAYENGIPHVHMSRGFARRGEEVVCEAVIDDMSELVPLLGRRTAWITRTLQDLGCFGEAPPRSIGVTGHSGCGKTLYARDAARLLEARGRPAVVVSLDDYLKAGIAAVDLASTAFWPTGRSLDHLDHAFEVEELVQSVLQPFSRGERARVRQNGAVVEVEPDRVLVVQGLFLLHPRVRELLDRVVYLDVSENQSLRRVAGRDAARHGPESLMRVRRHLLPTQRAFDEVVDPKEHADVVLDAENALGGGGASPKSMPRAGDKQR